jgi:hypothetical protein
MGIDSCNLVGADRKFAALPGALTKETIANPRASGRDISWSGAYEE